MAIDEQAQQQFETLAAIRAYAAKIAAMPDHDTRPSTARYRYAEPIKRMQELARTLDTKS